MNELEIFNLAKLGFNVIHARRISYATNRNAIMKMAFLNLNDSLKRLLMLHAFQAMLFQ